MQKRGMARRLHARREEEQISKQRRGRARARITRRHTERKDVSDESDDAKVEVAVLDILATTEDQGDCHGAGVAHRQEDDTHTGEGIVSRSGTKVDSPQGDLNDHAQCHRIEGDVELVVDSAPPARPRNAAITSKGPGASRGGRNAAHTADDTQHQQGDGEAESTGRIADRVFENDGSRLGGVDEQRQLRHDEADRDQEEETGDKVDDDRADHGLGDHDGGLANFFAETSQGGQYWNRISIGGESLTR